jgi:hypothetical protein
MHQSFYDQFKKLLIDRCVLLCWVAMVLRAKASLIESAGRAVAARPPNVLIERSRRVLRYGSPMIRIAISLAAYQAIASAMPKAQRVLQCALRSVKA